ncbi:MAG: ABC transporter ATP-binding protein [Clostridia bacterium]|nr:ABC transporter ATP-binding protein [Clostridia bacterium]
MSKNTSSNNQSATLKKVLRRIGRYRWLVLLSLGLSAVSVVLTLVVPILVGRAIDGIVGTGTVRFDVIWPLLWRIGVCVAVTALATWAMNVVNNRVTFDVVRNLREEALDHINHLPLATLDARPTGETVSRVIADADQLADGLLMGFTQLFSGVLTMLMTLAFMFTQNVPIALVVVGVTPLSLFVARFIARRTYAMFQAQSEARGEQTAFIDERIGNLKVVQAYGREAAETATFDGINARLRDCSLKATFYSSLTNPCTRFVNSVVYALVALTGALAALSGAGMTVGTLTAFLSYANQYTKPFNEISGVVTELQNAVACAARLFELIEAPAEPPDDPNAAPLADVKGAVDWQGVDFSYVPERPLIRDFNLSVKPGQRVAIVGPTGCGKTTLINLLMRFYEPQGGVISVDGRDTKKVPRGSLRAAYGMVLQETWLKAGTIWENIAMGNPDASMAQVEAAARAAHAHSFITRLPEGYDTVIGEDGGLLSQGQKQLLCISRVMLGRGEEARRVKGTGMAGESDSLSLPPMLILDEATSSIDTRTELKIQSAFARMMKGRTSFIVAHRLSTIREADVILVMRDGRIVEQGDHASLLEKGGFYAELYRSQFEGA